MAEIVKVDWQFVDRQLHSATLTEGVSKNEDALIRKLLHTLEMVGLTYEDLEDLKGVLETTVSLLNSEAIAVDLLDTWVDALPGDVIRRDRVRVKADAYSGKVGAQHNGKTGRVASLYNGKATVVYDGETAEGAPQHEITALQKLV